MSDHPAPPQHVLSDAVADVIDGQHLEAAAFVTYQLDPQFFEDRILPAIVGCEPGADDRVLRVLIDERLRDSGAHFEVFYDHQGLVPGGPTRQRIQYFPVEHPRGVLHAKHALLLLSEKEREDSLVLITTSANLTQTGWWENVEGVQIEVLKAGKSSSLRTDLLGDDGLLSLLRGLTPADGHPALNAIGGFLENAIPTSDGAPRLWLGAESLAEFLSAHVPPGRYRMELLAPYVDATAEPIRELHAALAPEETVVWFPVDANGHPQATAEWRAAVLALDGARFGELDGVDQSFGQRGGQRFVHAKLIRILDLDSDRGWTVTGSPNLTNAGQAGRRRGNIETALISEVDSARSWLEPQSRDAIPEAADEPTPPPEETERTRVPLRIRYDWDTSKAQYRLDRGSECHVRLSRGGESEEGHVGSVSFSAQPTGSWENLSEAAATWLRSELPSGNLLHIRTGDRRPQPLLVEETGLQRPDHIRRALTPSDILKYWSYLDPIRRQELLEEAVDAKLRFLDGLAPVEAGPRAADQDKGPRTMFDTFAGIFHAFLRLREDLKQAYDDGRKQLIVRRLLGTDRDSLRTLLDKVLAPEGEPTDVDPVEQVLILLSAQELYAVAEDEWVDILRQYPEARSEMEERLANLDRAWAKLDLGDMEDLEPQAFKDWFLDEWKREVELNP